MSNHEQTAAEIWKRLSSLPLIKSEEIPGIDLYMDQVTTFMEERLKDYRRNENEKILTKTMINNYAKNKLLPPPVKKKYSREHMLVLIFIYYLKGVLSLQDIQAVLQPLTQEYFQKQDGPDVQAVYDVIFASVPDWEGIIAHDIDAYEQLAKAASPDGTEAGGEDDDFLQYFSLICALSFDIFLKKKMIENLIDERNTNSTT